MEFEISTKKVVSLVATLVIAILVLGGCIGSTGTTSRGWAGVTEIDGTLIFASMSGKVYSVDGVTGEVRGDPIKMVITASGGLGCIPSCGGPQTTPIAMYASPGESGNLVYFTGTDGKVSAYQLVDGKLREESLWTYPRQDDLGAAVVGGLIVVDDKIYFATASGTVYALTAEEGYKEWSYDIGEKIWSAPAVEGDTIYLTSFDKKLYALDAVTGSYKWEYETKGAISAPPLVKDGLVYIGNYDRHLYAINSSGNLVWEFPADDEVKEKPSNWFWVTPVVYNDLLYAPCLDGKVYVLNARTGSYIDTISIGGAICSSPAVIDNILVVAGTNLAKNTSRVYYVNMIDRTSRELTSFTEGIKAPLFASNGNVYVHTSNDNFYGLNIQNGAQQKFSLTTSK